MPIVSLFRARVQSEGGAVCLGIEDKEYSYREIWKAALGVCRELHERVHASCASVGFETTDPARYVAGILGTWLAGHVPSPNGGEGTAYRLQFDRESGTEVSFTERPRELRLFTSGSTGKPKEIRLSEEALFANARAMGLRLGLGTSDRWLVATPISFTSGLCHFLTLYIAGGSTIFFRRPLFAEALTAALCRSRCTGVGGGPIHLYRLRDGGLALPPSVRRWMSSGDFLEEAILREVRARYPQVEFYNVYGLTEVAGRLCVADGKTPARSVGHPLFPESVRCEDGEIVVRSPTLMRGHSEYRTGDCGSIDAEGFVYLEGRRDDVFKVSGEKVAGRVVREALLSLGCFKDAHVAARSSALLGTECVAYVVLSEGKAWDPAQWRRALKNQLPLNHIPRDFTPLSELPRTASGKLDRRQLEAF